MFMQDLFDRTVTATPQERQQWMLDNDLVMIDGHMVKREVAQTMGVELTSHHIALIVRAKQHHGVITGNISLLLNQVLRLTAMQYLKKNGKL